jgi:hypothetical protein
VSYTAQTWTNGPNSGTPINATRLNHIEAGISAAATAADNANSAVATKASPSDISSAVGSLRAELFGGTARTKPYRCLVTYNAEFTQPANVDSFATAPGNWGAFSDPDGMFKNSSAGGGSTGYARLLIPVTGWWEIDLHILGDTSGVAYTSATIAVRSDSSTPTIGNAVAVEPLYVGGAANIHMNPKLYGVLNAGTYVYWSTWGSSPWALRGTKFSARTQISATWRGASS